MPDKVEFIDVTVRDGNQSLWGGTGLTTAQMLEMAPLLDRVGFKAIETITGILFKLAVTHHKENPWDKIRSIRRAVTKTPLRYGGTFRRFIGFKRMPDSVTALVAKTAASCGLRSTWIVDGMLDVAFLHKAAGWAKQGGFEEVVVALPYTISPVHTDEFYAEKARKIAECPDVDALYVKDQGGLFTPERVQTLVPQVLKNSLGKPVEIHVHCNTGLGPLCLLEAVKQGIRTVQTAIPPLANGTSHPSVFNILRNLRYMGYSTGLDEEALERIATILRDIAKKEGRPEGVIPEYDYFYYKHQVPGGMMSTLRRQLSEVRKESLMDKVLEEVVQVRQELGYPIMVTPFSQFVGVQAAYNIISGKRYSVIPDGVIEYAAGWYGQPIAPIDPNVLDKIAHAPKAKTIFGKELPQLSIKELREQLGIGPTVSDEEFLLRYAMSDKEIDDMFESIRQGTAGV
ncbi:MAG: 2-oxoglutarate carboxylase large subunit [Syntrophorhabdus sp. PtaU1.Bin050]|nr:MAG: 2-oxoglutarate carboxylase large subunit [Syntrophorhabdus sp. PtaU1.Bin050]